MITIPEELIQYHFIDDTDGTTKYCAIGWIHHCLFHDDEELRLVDKSIANYADKMLNKLVDKLNITTEDINDLITRNDMVLGNYERVKNLLLWCDEHRIEIHGHCCNDTQE